MSQIFKDGLKKAANSFLISLKESKGAPEVKLVSNLDADGIAAASIMTKMLERLGAAYSLLILHQLNKEGCKKIAEEEHDLFFFCDMGSGQINNINEFFVGKKVFIFDHHQKNTNPAPNIVHINPHDYGIDGSKEISAAGVCFLFAREVDKKNEDLAHLAVIGAIGDVQEKQGFSKLNSEILNIARKQKKMKLEKAIRLHGIETRPLVKLLTYSSELRIPGVTKDEQGAHKFLKAAGIRIFDNGVRTYSMLTKKEKEKLAKAIISRRKKMKIKDAEDIYAERIILPAERGAFRDAKEFSTLLNACGRLDKAGIGIAACLGGKREKKLALDALDEYKMRLDQAYDYVRNSKELIRGKNYLIINAKGNIPVTMIGTIASMLTKTRELKEGTILVAMARAGDGTTKVSMRISGNAKADLRSILDESMSKVDGESGGHKLAAGAVIDSIKEEIFISEIRKILEKKQ
jgi:single-stranded-DNA-specific exonuclease